MTITVPAIGQTDWGGPLNAALENLDTRVEAHGFDVKRDFGAVGDGVTNDTAAVQAALDAGGITFFPPGIYDCTTLQGSTGNVIAGPARSGYIPSSSADTATIRLRNGTNAALLDGADQVSNVVIRNMNFDGNKANNTSGNIINLVNGTAQDTAWHIEDCFLDNSANDGIFVGSGRQAVRVSRTWIMRSDNNGAVVNGNDAGFSNVLIGLSGSNSMFVGAGVQHITDCDMWSSTGHGLVIDTASMVSVIGCGIDRHQQSGIVVLGASDVTVANCLLHSNSQQTNNTYPHIRQDAGNLSVVGTVFGSDGFSSNPNYAIVPTGTAVLREAANRLVGGSTVTGYISDPSKVANSFTGNVSVALGSQLNIGASGSGASLAVLRAAGTDSVLSTRVTGDTATRFFTDANGLHSWGPGGAGAADTTMNRSGANALALNTADFRIATIGRGLRVAEGSNAKQGASVLAGGTVTVGNTSVTANSRILLTTQIPGGTVGYVYISARNPGTDFTITSLSALDTSTVAWSIQEPA